MRVAEGFESIDLVYAFQTRNFYTSIALLWDEKDVVLCDTGLPGQLPDIKKAMADAGLPFERLTKIIVSHPDIDHIGGLREITESLPNVEVFASETDAPHIDGTQPFIKSLDRTIATVREEEKPKYLAPLTARVAKTVADGEILPFCGGLQVIATPGHTPGHISLLHIPSRTLITADAITCVGGDMDYPPKPNTPDMDAAKASAKKLLSYDWQRALFSHGGLFGAEAREKLKDLVEKEKPPMWKIHQPVQIVFGQGEIKSIGTILAAHDLKRAFLITGKSMVRGGIADTLQAYSQGRIIGVSSDVEPDPDIENVDRNAALVRAAEADCLIAMGGGSTIDCAKCVAVAAAEGCTGAELLARRPVSAALPIIAIPSTAGSGSEVTSAASLNDKKKGLKGGVMSPLLYPRVSVIDPELSYSVPKSVTAHTGFDVLAHALDVLTSVNVNPYSQLLAVQAANLAFENLEKVVRRGDDHEARANMSLACLMAGLAFSQVGTTASHACAAALSTKYDIAHGEACAFTLDSWFAINAKARPSLDDTAKALGFENARAVSDRMSQMKEAFGMRATLTQLGGSEADIPALAELTMAGNGMKVNVAKPTAAEVEALYRSKL